MVREKRRDYKPYFLLLILIIVILFGLLMKCHLDLLKSQCTIYVTSTTTTTTTLVQPKTPVIVRTCTADLDCDWLSTNCCTETAGANWECISKQSDVTCTGVHVICPQVISPKPTAPCVCIHGTCGRG